MAGLCRWEKAIDYTEENTRITPMISIDSMNLPRVDLIKIDIEGMEIEALEGASHTIQKSKPQLIIEKIKSNEQALTRFLSSPFPLFPGQWTGPIHLSASARRMTEPSLLRKPSSQQALTQKTVAIRLAKNPGCGMRNRDSPSTQ